MDKNLPGFCLQYEERWNGFSMRLWGAAMPKPGTHNFQRQYCIRMLVYQRDDYQHMNAQMKGNCGAGSSETMETYV